MTQKLLVSWIRCAALGSGAAFCAGAFGPTASAQSHYQEFDLVSDGSVPADHIDTNLVNPWGIAFSTNGPAWVANNHSGTSTSYNGAGVAAIAAVTIPGSSPTGMVFNPTNDFEITATHPAVFLFATEDGTIDAWSPAVDPTHAFTMVDKGAAANYKGLALGGDGTRHLLYAANFFTNSVDVFDTDFNQVSMPGAFVDPAVPSGFAPFGIQNLQGEIYVAYAMQDALKEDEIAGPHLGIVDVFSPAGVLIRRVARGGALDAPWGMALAPAGFGAFGGALLIGNFGDGRISAYDPITGAFLGQLEGCGGAPLSIDGLWGIGFGNGVDGQPIDELYFAAGVLDEVGGLYGKLVFDRGC